MINGGEAQPTVGGVVPGRVVLACIKKNKQAEQDMESKLVSTTPP